MSPRRTSAVIDRRARPPRLFAVCVLALCFVAPHSRADDLSTYLEQRGLNQLLAVHLEQQLSSLTGEQRDAAIRRLADIYAQLLEREIDPVRRVALEERSRQLLEQAPARSADELRLALLRASYRTAEKIAENHRLRLAKPEEVDTATRTFGEIAPQLQALREQMKESIQSLERRQSRASGVEANALGESLDRARGLLAQCVFLAAWSLYYQDWLGGTSSSVRLAEPLFAELIGAESTMPSPEDISVDLRSSEAVARSILGMALCKSISSSSATAIAWVTLLTHPQAYEPLRLQAPIWTMAIHLEHREYRQAAEVLDQERSLLPEIPLAWLRLCAVYALEEPRRDRFVDELVRFAVTELAARGELQQVLDLATRYGVNALGDTGFALKYVQGVIKYQEARARHEHVEPTLDESLRSLYREASDALKAAAAESDAERYPLAAAACKRLIAWCAYFRGEFLEARREFESAAAALSGAEAAEALWMAIVSLDKVAQSGRSPESQVDLDGLIDRYITLYPGDSNTAKLLLKRSTREREPSPEAVAQLLAIAPDSDVYPAAQARAADMLYQLFRASTDPTRAQYAGQFLSVAVPLISQPPNSTKADDALARLVIRCRQVLEIALTEGVERLLAARAAFDALQTAGAIDQAAIEASRDEIDCRRVQERLLSDEIDEASAIAGKLWDRSSNSIWARLAMRSMFKQAYRVWKNPEASAAQRDQAIDRVVRDGGRVLHEFMDDPAALDRPGAIGYYAAVAEATMAQWERTRAVERAEAALFLYDQLLAKRPSSAQYLRAAALLAEATGRPEKALDHWRRIVAGTNQESPGWYEAKFHQILTLAKLDPSRAREVLNQHKQLHPEFGPEPWGAMLKGLDQQIPMNPAADATSVPPASAPDEGGGQP